MDESPRAGVLTTAISLGKPLRNKSISGYRVHHVIFSDTAQKTVPRDQEPNELLEFEFRSVVNTKRRSTEPSYERQQKVTSEWDARKSNETELVNSVAKYTYPKPNTYRVNFDPVEPKRKDGFPSEHSTNCTVTTLQNLSTANEKHSRVVDSKMEKNQYGTERKVTISAFATVQPTTYSYVEEGEDETAGSTAQNNFQQTVENKIRVQSSKNLREMPKSISTSTPNLGQQDNDINCVRGKAHWYELSSPTAQQLSPTRALYSNVDRSKPQKGAPASLEHKAKLVDGHLEHSDTVGRSYYPHRKTRFQEYKLPEELGKRKSDPAVHQQGIYLMKNPSQCVYPDSQNRTPFDDGCAVKEDCSVRMPLSDFTTEKKSHRQKFQKQETKARCHTDDSVALEYYDINSDQELDTLINRRRTKSLTDYKTFIECFPSKMRGAASSDDVYAHDVSGHDLICSHVVSGHDVISGINAFRGDEKRPPGAVTSSRSIKFLNTAEADAKDNQRPIRNHVPQNASKQNYYFSETGHTRTINGNLNDRDHGQERGASPNNKDVVSSMSRGIGFQLAGDADKNCRYILEDGGNNSKAKNDQERGINNPEKPLLSEQYPLQAGTTKKFHANTGERKPDRRSPGSITAQFIHSSHNTPSPGTHSRKPTEHDSARSTPEVGTFTNTLFQRSIDGERNTRNASFGKINLDMARSYSTSSLLASDINDTDSDDVRGDNPTGTQSIEEFKRTLRQLSRYVLAGYKENMKLQRTASNTEKNGVTTGFTYDTKCYHLDEEDGELSEVKEQFEDFKRLSMVVNVISRLRELYTIVPLPKSQYHGIKKGYESHNFEENKENDSLCEAIENRSMSEVKNIILNSLNVDINLRSESGFSSLHKAAEEGDIEGLRILIEHDADLNASDRHGYPPVHYALQRYHYKAAMFLMDCGTDLMSYTSKRVEEFVKVKATAKQYLRQNLKTSL